MDADEERMDDETGLPPDTADQSDAADRSGDFEPGDTYDESQDQDALDASHEAPVETDFGPTNEPIAADEVPDDVPEMTDAAPETADQADEPMTLSVLDATGSVPKDYDVLLDALRHWEAMAQLTPDDPHFTPQPTTKARKELLLVDRGPTKPLVWLDRAAMRPVSYTGDVDTRMPGDPPPALPRISREVFTTRPGGESTSNSNVFEAQLGVRLSRAEQHYLDALDAHGDRWQRLMNQIAEDHVNVERFRIAAEERAIDGDW